MIKYFLYLFMLPFVLFCQQKEVLHQDFFEDGSIKHEWYLSNNHPVKHWKTYTKNNTKHYQRNYNDNGKLISEGWYKNNLKNGYNIEYFENNHIEKGHYVNGLKEKHWEYVTNYNLDSIGEYHLNKPISKWVYYDKKCVSHQKNYLGNNKDYTVNYYYKNGNLKSEGIFKNNQKSGYWKNYSKKGVLISCGSFKNNLKNGYWHFYSEKGNLIEKGNFIKDQKSKWWSFFSIDGVLSHKCELKKNKLDGYCVYYEENEIIKGQYFKKGIKIKEWNDWSSFKEDYLYLNE